MKQGYVKCVPWKQRQGNVQLSWPGKSEGIDNLWYLEVELNFKRWVGFYQGENGVGDREDISRKMNSRSYDTNVKSQEGHRWWDTVFAC